MLPDITRDFLQSIVASDRKPLIWTQTVGNTELIKMAPGLHTGNQVVVTETRQGSAIQSRKSLWPTQNKTTRSQFSDINVTLGP